MKRTYTVECREEGRGNPVVRTFKTLADLQTYVRDRWFGVEYIDGPTSFHSDYATFDISGAKLRDLGDHMGPYGTDDYWSWEWRDLAGVVETSDAPVEPDLCPVCGRPTRNGSCDVSHTPGFRRWVVETPEPDSCPVCGRPTRNGAADCGCLWK